MRAKDNRPPKQHKIQDYFNQKKSKKQQKEKHKQFVKCPLVGQVGSQLKRVLQQYRQEIMKEFDYAELAKQLSQLTHFHNLANILNSVLYLGITRTSDQVSEIYQPEHVDDLLSCTNVQRLKNWLKHSFAMLRGDESGDSDSLETNSQGYSNSNLLNIFGASGKMSTIVAIARTYNIEVLYTFDYTEKREFEEMFASQHIQFEQHKQRKIIIHRGPLPKFINQRMLQVQKVPFIWITDNNQQHELFESFELQQYGHDELLKLLYVIMFIECNYRDQIIKINEEFKSKVIYESIKEKGEFYKTFALTKPKIAAKQVQVPFTVSEIYILIIHMCGNMRTVLNWMQFNLNNVHEQISTMQIGEKQLDYMITNRLCSVEMENGLREWFQEQKIELTDDIVKSRKHLLDENYKTKAYYPRLDYHLVNYALKVRSIVKQAIATNNPTHKTRRLNRERTDIYKPLSQFFGDQEQFERFKQLDQF